MTAITEVWVVQEEDGSVASVQAEEPSARVVRDLRQLGNTVTRETLLTPEMAAVIEAAKALVLSEGDSDTKFCSYTELLALQRAVATLRAQEGA